MYATWLFCPGPICCYCGDFETSGADGRLANVTEEPLEERSTTSVVVVIFLKI